MYAFSCPSDSLSVSLARSLFLSLAGFSVNWHLTVSVLAYEEFQDGSLRLNRYQSHHFSESVIATRIALLA